MAIQLHTNTPLVCPCCSKPLDGVSHMQGPKFPKQGDVSVCIYCGEALQFTGKGMDLQLEILPTEVWEDLRNNHSDTYEQLSRYITTIKSMHG